MCIKKTNPKIIWYNLTHCKANQSRLPYTQITDRNLSEDRKPPSIFLSQNPGIDVCSMSVCFSYVVSSTHERLFRIKHRNFLNLSRYHPMIQQLILIILLQTSWNPSPMLGSCFCAYSSNHREFKVQLQCKLAGHTRCGRQIWAWLQHFYLHCLDQLSNMNLEQNEILKMST